ncbi:hypothetical protein Droror1_Dr00012634 [Drosera rotundifolia]
MDAFGQMILTHQSQPMNNSLANRSCTQQPSREANQQAHSDDEAQHLSTLQAQQHFSTLLIHGEAHDQGRPNKRSPSPFQSPLHLVLFLAEICKTFHDGNPQRSRSRKQGKIRNCQGRKSLSNQTRKS